MVLEQDSSSQSAPHAGPDGRPSDLSAPVAQDQPHHNTPSPGPNNTGDSRYHHHHHTGPSSLPPHLLPELESSNPWADDNPPRRHPTSESRSDHLPPSTFTHTPGRGPTSGRVPSPSPEQHQHQPQPQPQFHQPAGPLENAAFSPVSPVSAADSPSTYWQTSLPYRDHSATSDPYSSSNNAPQFQSNNPFLKAVQQRQSGHFTPSNGDLYSPVSPLPPDDTFSNGIDQSLNHGRGGTVTGPQIRLQAADDRPGVDLIWGPPVASNQAASEDLIDFEGRNSNVATHAAQAPPQESLSLGPTSGSPSDPVAAASATPSPPPPQPSPETDLAPPPQSIRASPLSESEIRRREEILAETYDIRIVNWTNGRTPLRQSPVLVQNANGPCPLLALVNALVLRTSPTVPIQSPIVKVLQSKEKISLNLLIHALFDELTTYVDEESQLPDIEALSSFLTILHTGMNVNPRLTAVTSPEDTPGTFMQTRDINLYSSFNLPLVHGWLAPPTSDAHRALRRVGEYHEDIQLLGFRKEELEDKASRGATLGPNDLQLLQDIECIQHFFNVQNATQLSRFGLDHLTRCLKPGSVSILFRNDHFSTLFKHPVSHQLFTLVTDMGFAGHAEIVWESLVDVNGSESELYSGDFRPVSHGPSSSFSSQPQTRNLHDNAAGRGTTYGSSMLPHDESDKAYTEQTDADYAYALALQFQDEEEQRARREQTRARTETRQSAPAAPPVRPGIAPGRPGRLSQTLLEGRGSTSRNTGRRSIGQSQPPQPQTVRSLIPHSGPTAGDDPNAPPPTYEQAAKAPAYVPPAGHPQYPGPATTTTAINNNNSNNHLSHSSSGMGMGMGVAGPRSSSYGFSPGQSRAGRRGEGSMDIRRNHQSISSTSLPERPQREKKDCIVM